MFLFLFNKKSIHYFNEITENHWTQKCWKSIDMRAHNIIQTVVYLSSVSEIVVNVMYGNDLASQRAFHTIKAI